MLFAWGVIWGLPAGLLFVVMRHRTAEVPSPALFERAHTEV